MQALGLHDSLQNDISVSILTARLTGTVITLLSGTLLCACFLKFQVRKMMKNIKSNKNQGCVTRNMMQIL